MLSQDKSFACDMAKEYWKRRFKKHTGLDALPRDLTPLRYPGGKGSLKYFLANIIIDNNLYGKGLVEPFCGGGGASIPLLVSGVVGKLYINDASPAIYSFWKSVFFDTDNFIRLIESCKVDVENWRLHKEVVKRPFEHTDLELGFSTFFLNRCNRSGLLFSGPIGGMGQAGKYKIDCRFNKKNLISRVEKISSYRDRVCVSGNDACEYMNGLSSRVVNNSLIFMDPPYVGQGGNLYKEHSFDEEGHERLSNYIKPKLWKWVITYDDNELIHKLYAERALGVIEISYLMQSLKMGRELLIAAMHCKIPFPGNEKEIMPTNL